MLWERETDFVVKRAPEPELVAEPQGGGFAQLARRKHNAEWPLVPKGETLEQRRRRSWMRAACWTEHGLQDVVRRCPREDPDPVGLR